MFPGHLVEMETDEIALLDFPDEILLEIFGALSDHSLLQAVRVCKRFKIITAASFAKKYGGLSKTFYSLKISGENSTDEQKQYEEIFCTFGECMTAIKIDFMGELVVRHHWLIFFIQRYCKSITKVTITNGKQVDLASIICCMPNLTDLSLEYVELLNQEWTRNYPKLVHFSGRDSKGDNEAFEIFINHNPQLESLSLIRFCNPSNNILYALNDKFDKLKNLELVGEKAYFSKKSTIIRMHSLKTLTFRINGNSLVPLLESIRDGFKTIEELTMYQWSPYKLNVRDINLLCSFNMLKKLVLTDAYKLPFKLLKLLIMHLPNLVTFSLGNSESLCKTHDDLLSVVSVCLNLSLLELEVIPELPILDYEFCTRFANIIEINGSNLKLELYSQPDKIILTRDEARFIKDFDENQLHSILYWKGYDAASTPSNKNLLELNKEILNKIATFLDGKALSAFYQTCKRAQQLVIEHITENVFHCAVTPIKHTNENVFMILGKHVKRINVDLEHDTYDDADDEDVEGTASHELKTKFLKCVNQYCGENSTEMVINSRVQIKTILYWPNLRKLNFSYINARNLQLFHCPELTHLDIYHYINDVVNVSINWEILFPNLISLKFEFYDESVETFLCGLSRTICNHISNLSLTGEFKKEQRLRWLKLTNIIARFGRLVTLHLNIKGIEESNFKFLFENCSKLTELLIFFNGLEEDCLKMFCTIKLNCNELETIQLVGESSTFRRSSLQKIYSMFPKVTFSLIDVKIMKCLCTLNKTK